MTGQHVKSVDMTCWLMIVLHKHWLDRQAGVQYSQHVLLHEWLLSSLTLLAACPGCR